MKKILIPLYYYYPYVSGLSVYTKRLAEGLVADGYDVTVLTTQFDRNLAREEVIGGVRVIRCPVWFSIGKGIISPRFLLYTFWQTKMYDVINFQLPLPEAGIASLFLPKKKVYITYHCDVNLGKGILNKIIQKVSYILMSIALARSQKVITLSLNYLGASKARKYLPKACEVFPPIDTSQFTRVEDTSYLKNKLGLRSDEFLIGFVGRIVYEKGINYLLQAIEFLENEIPSFRVVIAGDFNKIAGGGIKSELAALEKEFAHRILFVGFLPDEELASFYSMIDVLVLPSIDPLEAFGMVQVEAMCCGCPVIASDLPGVRTPVSKTGFGYLVAPKNAHDIAEKIKKIYKDGVSSHRFNRECWALPNAVNSVIQVIKAR